MFSLANKTALLLGGTAGLGLAVASSYVQAGAKIIIVGRRSCGESIADEIGADFVHRHGQAQILRCSALREEVTSYFNLPCPQPAVNTYAVVVLTW